MSERLVIKNVHVAVEGQEILKGVDLTIGRGESACGSWGPMDQERVLLGTLSWATLHTR